MRGDQAPQGDTRVIIHIDLDAFYAQVHILFTMQACKQTLISS
jgi:hypothetical protein